MISNCGGGDPHLYNLSEMAFIIDVGLLMLVATPAAIGYVLWRIFVTNRTSPSRTTLGLNEELSAEGYSFPWRALFTRAAVGVATFEFGVIVYETCCY